MDVVIFVTPKLNINVINRFHKIKNAASLRGMDCFMLVEENQDTIYDINHNPLMIGFSFEKLYLLGIKTIKNSIIPGSNHLITLYFYKKFPFYDNYYSIEYDVDFLGDWEIFFKISSILNADFVSSHVKTFQSDPNWYWWNHFFYYHNDSIINRKYIISKNKRIRSFNPIYRISNDALKYLYEALKEGIYGHHEVVIPTILYYGGFKLLDWGGSGEFVSKGMQEKLYKTTDQYSPLGSLSHLAFANNRIPSYWKDILVHPLKL